MAHKYIHISALAGVMAFLLADGALAQALPWPTTHEAAQCLDDADQPVCLLRIVSRTIPVSLRATPEFENAPEIVAAVEGSTRTSTEADALTDRFRSFRDSMMGGVEGVLVQVMRADQRGASPTEALAPIAQSNRGDGHLLDGEAMRQIYLSAIWAAYLGEDRSVASVGIGDWRPSRALANATLDERLRILEVKRDLGDEDQQAPLDLARAYARLDNHAGIGRAMRLDPRPELVRSSYIALLSNNLTEASRIFSQALDANLGVENLFILRADLTRAAIDANRRDIIVTMARAAADPRANYATSGSIHALAGEAIGLLVENASPQESRRFIEELDAAGRDPSSYTSAWQASLAALGWRRLQEPDRLQALLDSWTSAIRRQEVAFDNASLASNVLAIFEAADRVDLAWGLPRFDASTAITWDLQNGHGATRLVEHLSHSSDAIERNRALQQCMSVSAHKSDWESGLVCLSALDFSEEPASSSQPPYYQSPPYVALQFAAAAAGAGRDGIMTDALRRGLASLRTLSAARWNAAANDNLKAIAVRQLRSQGRLPGE